jgi:hypothetical protein
MKIFYLLNNLNVNKHHENTVNIYFYRFYVSVVQNNKKLILSIITENKLLYYLSDNKLYEILYSTYCSICHRECNRMVKTFSIKYKNITLTEI